ncbi:UNVERIFIED_CONTAM: hypothetical protein GTU68_009327 [Idotea baltica]|nr:hypothetical protein [Idotea baltica]
MALAEKIGPHAVIINADAFQIYRNLDILTAAPSAEDQQRVPHELYGIIDPSETCDAARYSRLAEEKIAELVAEKQFPIVVGGSGLYIKALTHGLGPTPPGDPELRAELDKLELEELYTRLEKVDPVGAAATNKLNRRYVTRNLEISILTGVPASTLKQDFENSAPDFNGIFLTRDREHLYERINRRTHEMFAEGVVEEVKNAGELSTTAEKAIGLREIQQLIAGELSEADCIEVIQQATRKYSKRQRTWFKREKGFQTLEIDGFDSAEEIAERISLKS